MAFTQNQKISFIPKKALVKGGGSERRPISLTLFITLLVLVLVWGGYGGLYLYSQSIQVSIDDKKAQLRDFKTQFDMPLIARAQALEKRINVAGSLINNHTLIAQIFGIFEQSTVSTAYISDFSFTNEKESVSNNTQQNSGGGVGSGYVLKLSAITPSFAVAADLQDAFTSRTDIFTGVDLAGISLDAETGEVSVDFLIGVKPELVTYGGIAPTKGVPPAASINTEAPSGSNGDAPQVEL